MKREPIIWLLPFRNPILEHTHKYKHTPTYTHTIKHTHKKHRHTYTHPHTHIHHPHTCTHIHTLTYIPYTRTHTHTCMHTHTHTYANRDHKHVQHKSHVLDCPSLNIAIHFSNSSFASLHTSILTKGDANTTILYTHNHRLRNKGSVIPVPLHQYRL